MGTELKRARFVTDDPNRVLELIELEGSDHEAMKRVILIVNSKFKRRSEVRTEYTVLCMLCKRTRTWSGMQ